MRIFAIGTILFAFLALVVFLWPVTDTWYLGDDPYIAFQVDAATQRGASPVGFVVDAFRDAAGHHGRFAPLGALSLFAFWLTPSVFIYKIGVIVVVLLSVGLTAVLLTRLGFSAPYAALLPLVLCAIVQLRYWHDPVLAYSAGLPIVACLVTGSLVALAEAIRRRRLTLYVMALTLFFAGCLYYEGTALLAPVVVPVAWSLGDDSIVAIVRRTAPFFGVAAVSIGLVLGLRAGASAEPEPTAKLYRPSLAPRAVASGLAKQVSGSLPLSYLVAVVSTPDVPGAPPPESSSSVYGSASAAMAVPAGFVNSERSLVVASLRRSRTALLMVLVGLGIMAALWSASRLVVRRRAIVGAVAVGGWFVVGGGLALALSARWQQQTFYGIPYLAVFLEYLGVAIIAVAMVALLFRALARRRRLRTGVIACAAAAVTALAVATNALNERVVAAFSGVKAVMELNEHALKDGLLRKADAADELVLGQGAPLTQWFVSVSTGMPAPPTISVADFDRWIADCQGARACVTRNRRVAYVSALADRGLPWAAVCTIDSVASRDAGAAACVGHVLVAAGGKQFPSTRCRALILDGVAASDPSARSALPVRLKTAGEPNTDLTFCQAALQSPVFVRSLAVGPRRGVSDGRLRIVAIGPSETRVGVGFNIQPSGRSAIGVSATGVTPSTRVLMNGVDVPTQYVSPQTVTALVPREVLARPGRVSVRLRDRGIESNVVFLNVSD